MTRKPLVPQKEAELDKFKWEVAKEMHIQNEIERDKIGNGGNLTSETVGKLKHSGNLGGEMVKKMIASVERDMANKSNSFK